MPPEIDVLEQRITKMMTDTCKGLATKDELHKAVKETTSEYLAERDADKDKAFQEAQEEAAQLQLTVKDMVEQIKFLRRTRYESIKAPDGSYSGIWPTLDMAKNFGLFVMSDIMRIPEAKKAFDATGIERRMIVGDKIVKALSSDDLTAGAVLAPSDFIPQLITLIEAFSTYRQLAQEMPLGSSDQSIPVQTSDVTVYCPAAGVSATEGNLGFKSLGLNPLEWVAYAAINRNLDEDAAIPVGEVVGRSLARAFGNQEDSCGFVGDGTSTYFNILGARAALRAVDATITNCKGLKVQDTAGAWSSIDLQDFLAVAGLLPQYAEFDSEIAWISSKAFYLTVMLNAALSAGGSFAAEILRPDYLVNPVFLGRKVKFGGGMPTAKEAADHCPALYGNWKMGAALGDRRKMTIEQSKEVKFLERQIVIMGTERIAINNHGIGNTTNAGPLVGLWADIA